MTDPPPRDDGRRIPDAAWARVAPLIPPRPAHPLGCHNPPMPDRRALDAILLAFRTRCRWGDLAAMGLASRSAAHRRFLEWSDAGLFAALRALGDPDLDALAGGDWAGPPRRRRSRALPR